MSEETTLPEGWCRATLDAVTEPTRIGVRPQDFPSLPFVGMEHVEAETMRLIDTVPASDMRSNALRFGPGDVLYGRLRPYLNKVLRPEFEGLCSAEFIVFRRSPHLAPAYLQYFLNSWRFKTFASHLNTGDRPRVDWDQLKGFDFPLPPLSEQHRIVEAIEQQFTRLDAGVTALKRAQAALKRYRATVLKAAVEGKLTEAWRAAHPDIEPASNLLERTLVERRAKWEADLRAKGKDPTKAKYEEPKGPDTANLPELPQGWCWATLEQCSDETRAITYGVIKLGEHVAGGVPTLRSSNVRHLKLELEGLKSIAPSIANQYERTFLCGGELLVTVRGTLGGVVVAPTTCAGYNISREVAMVVCLPQVLPSCLAIFVGSPPLQNWLLRNAKGIAYTGINIETLKLTPVPLAPNAEQEVIVEWAEQRLSVVSELEATIEANLKRAERLRQSILERAFSGQLVSQDPNDEPAELLLECIREQRSGRVGQGSTSRKDTSSLQVDEPVACVVKQRDLWRS